MNESTTSAASSSPNPPRPRRSLLRFLFRTPLGITTVLIVALGVSLALAPTLGSGFAKKYASDWFAKNYYGQLSIGALELGWSGPQTIEAAELKDDKGERVALVSARLPGLWSLATSGGKQLGKIEITGEANLEADAAGRTNLDRALEPRQARADKPVEPAGDTSESSAKNLEVELDVRISRIQWADQHTRELGKPFVLENLTLAAVLKPGEPLTARLRATLSGSAKGELSLDSKIEHPFDAPSSATPPKAEITAKVEHLPTALVDALAQQTGKLQALLGEELSLSLDAKGTLEQGSFDLKLDAPHGSVRGSARVAQGVLRSEGDGFAVDLEVPQAFVELVARPLLESGAQLVHIEPVAGKREYLLHVALNSFEAPIGAYLEASAKGDPKRAMELLLAGVRAKFSADLGDWQLAGSSALAGRGPLIVREILVSGELKAPQEDSLLEFSFSASNASRTYGESESKAPAAAADMAFGQAKCTLTFPGGATLAGYSPDQALLPLKASIRMENVPSAIFDSFAKSEGDLTRVLGGKLGLDVDIETSIAAAAAPGLAWADIAVKWRELANRASAQATLKLRGTPAGEKIARFGGEPFSVHDANFNLTLVPEKPLELRAQANFDSSAPGKFELQASLADVFANPAAKLPLRFAVTSSASGLPTRIAGALSGQGDRVQQLLGRYLAFDANLQGTLDEGVARINLSSESAQVQLAGRLLGGMFVNLDEPVLRVSLQPDARLLDEFVGPSLPKGTRFAFAESRGVVGVDVNFLALPVKELIEAAAKSNDAVLAVALAKTRCDAVIGLREFVYQDEALAAAGQRIDALTVQLEIELRPGDKLTPLKLDLHLLSPSFGEQAIELHIDAPHAPELLAIAQGAPFAPLVLRLSGKAIPTALLDSYAGGALREALGPKLDLGLTATLAQVAGEPFAANASLELGAAAGKSTVTLAAHATDPFDPAKKRPAGVLPQLEASIDVSGAGALLAFAPADLRTPLRELCGETIAARVKYAASAPGSDRAEVSLDAGKIKLGGAFDYTERVLTTIAGQPLVLSVAPDQATLDRLLVGKLPAGASLKLSEAGGALVVQLNQLRAPLGRFFDADPKLARAELVENLDLKLDANLPAFVYTHPGAPAGAAGTAATPPAVVTLRDVQLKVVAKPAAAATLDLTGAVDATPPGAIEAHVVIEKPAGFLVEAPAPFPAPGSRAKLSAKLARFPAALLDVLARQDGLLLDVLGPELEATIEGVYPDAGGEPLRAQMHSKLGDIALVSRLTDGVIVSEGEQGLDAKVGLTPLFSKRIIGSLVPMMVQLRQDDPTKRTILSGRNLALPMDGDLAKLSGDIDLNLGEVEYQLLPGMAQALQLVGQKVPTSKSTVVKPIPIKIKNGIAHYDSIPVRVGDRDINFHGNTNLALKTFELAFVVPLEMLGSKVEAQLEPLRNVLDPKTEVPLELYGSWTSPKIRLGKGFLEKALKKAGEEALKGGLEDGLGGLFGKKKKKKGG